MKFLKYFLLLLSILPLTAEKLQHNAMLYVHGFGESKTRNDISFYQELGETVELLAKDQTIIVPAIDKKAGDLSNAAFYTKKSVHKLANKLKKQIDAGDDRLDIIGRSNGAGVLTNTLDKLTSYEKHTEYFKDTKIKSVQDAKAIIDAVNKGSLLFQAPLLDMRHVQALNTVSRALSMATIGTATATAYYYFGPTLAVSKFAWCTGAYGAHLLVGTALKNKYRSVLHNKTLPWLTNYNFDPNHTTPLQASANLKGKLTCPILVHFNEYDGVVNDFDGDSIAFAQNIANDKTHICVTHDGSHNKQTQSYGDAIQYFALKYWNKLAIPEADIQNFAKNITSPVDLAKLKQPQTRFSRVLNTVLWGRA